MAKPVRTPQLFGFWLPNDSPIARGGIEVTNLADDHLQLIPLGEIWVPPSFTANVDREALPRLELEIELLERRFRCTSLRVLPRDEGDYIATSALQRIPIAKLVREAVELVTYLMIELREPIDVEFARAIFTELADLDRDPVALDAIRIGDYFRYPALTPLLLGDEAAYRTKVLPQAIQRLHEGERRTRRGSPTDEQVAAAYKLAFAQGIPVIDAVAEHFQWARQTAKNRIAAVRAGGHLPSTKSGRASA